MADVLPARILVTGASGLLGHVLVRDIAAAGDVGDVGDVVAVSHHHPLRITGVRTTVADLADPTQVTALLRAERPDLVVNCAALTRPEQCEADPDLADALNAALPGELARGCAAHGARLVHVSTDAVYGTAEAPYREGAVPQPVSRYARSKLAGEQAALTGLADALVLRVNFFGWSAQRDRSLAEFFLAALRARRPVTGFTDVEFSPLYHRDLVDAMVRAVGAGLTGVWNAGGSEALSKFAFGRAVAHTFDLDEELVRAGSRHDSTLTAARTDRLTMDSGRLAAAIGGLPGVHEGLRRMRADERSGYDRELTLQLTAAPTG